MFVDENLTAVVASHDESEEVGGQASTPSPGFVSLLGEMLNTWYSTADGLHPAVNDEGVSQVVRLLTRSGIVLGNYYKAPGLYFDEEMTPVVATHYQLVEGDRSD